MTEAEERMPWDIEFHSSGAAGIAAHIISDKPRESGWLRLLDREIKLLRLAARQLADCEESKS